MIYRAMFLAAIAASGFGAGWQAQSWRFSEKEKHRAEETLVAVQHSAAESIRRADNVLKAQNEAAARNRRLRSAADAARTESERLRDASNEALSRAKASLDACNAVAASYATILAEGTDFIQEVARDADGCFSDTKLMSDAWPK